MNARISAGVAAMALAFGSGCHKAPVEAPDEIGELAAYMFENFDNEDAAELIAGTPTLKKFITGLDPENAELDDRAFSMPVLTEKSWGTVSGPKAADPNMQLPMAVVGASEHKLKANRELMIEKNQVCIESLSTKYYDRAIDEGKDCFVSGDCEYLLTTNEVRKETTLAKVWYDLYKDYRTVVLDDETEVVYSRSWTEKSFAADGGNNTWDQIYSFEAWIPKGDTTLRFYVLWSEAHIGGVGDDFYSDLVKNGIYEGMLFADRFANGKKDCGNDRAYDPERE